MAMLAARGEQLIEHLKRVRPEDVATHNLVRRFSRKNVQPLIADKTGEQSHTVDKRLIRVRVERGYRHLCGASLAPDGFENKDALMYVFLHLLTHVARDEYGHTAGFWWTFMMLLREASITGLMTTTPAPEDGDQVPSVQHYRSQFTIDRIEARARPSKKKTDE